MRIGIIGCGGIARGHVNGYLNAGCSITALADVQEAARTAMAAECGNPAVECFADAAGLLGSGKVDAVSICTPPVAHEAAAIAALQKGIHVLCEKPLAGSIQSAQAVSAAAKASSAVFMMAFRHRLIPANRKIKELLETGAVGAPVMFKNVFGGPSFAMKDRWFTKKSVSGGGCLLDTNAHSVDLFRFFFGEVVEQHAVMHRHFENTDVEDAGIIIMKAANGTLGSAGSGFVLGEGLAYIDILGQDGRILFEYKTMDTVKWRKRGEAEWRTEKVAVSNGMNEQIGHFLNAINGREPLPISIKDGLRCQEIIQSNYK